MTPSYRFVVTGRVQGVGFRASAQGKALFLGLRGWIRNRDDGAVEGLVGGDNETDLQAFRDFLSKGSPAAQVEQFEWSETSEPAEDGFLVKR
ncbi:acylphosphatase [Nevskia soli]|uniref:acylphosphatase n=1 Tax=Nevskia soli TaxID=418856 RepID=UPI0004A73113|nr:acylphosphatase [Nevskia soli]